MRPQRRVRVFRSLSARVSTGRQLSALSLVWRARSVSLRMSVGCLGFVFCEVPAEVFPPFSHV